MSHDQHTTIRFSDITYSFEDGSIIRDDGTNLELRPQSVEVLSILARNAGNIVSKDTLITHVWPGLNVTDDSLVQCIADIRRAIGEDGHTIIKTVPKKGYKLVQNTTLKPRTAHLTPFRLAAMATMLLVVTGVGLWSSQTWAPDPVVVPGEDAAHEIRTEPSIVVLPFEDLTGDERWARLGRGLAADVTSELARNDWLFVVAPETSNQSLGSDPINFGRSLGVRFIATGTVQSDGQKLRIGSRLTDTSDGKVLWADTWTRPAEDLFEVQDEIMSRIGSSLSGTYSSAIDYAQFLDAKQKPTSSLDAYEHFLIGKEQKQTFQEEGLQVAIEHLEKAVEIDPNFGRAWATLSLTRYFLGDFQLSKEETDSYVQASHDAAQMGFNVSPNDPDVLFRMAGVMAEQGREGEISRYLDRALKHSPNDADLLASAAWLGSTSGTYVEDVSRQILGFSAWNGEPSRHWFFALRWCSITMRVRHTCRCDAALVTPKRLFMGVVLAGTETKLS